MIPLHWYLGALVLLASTFLFISLQQIDIQVENDIARYMTKSRTEKKQKRVTLVTKQQMDNSKYQVHTIGSFVHNSTLAMPSRSKLHVHNHDLLADTILAQNVSASSNPLPVPKIYQPYWNLACPLELSMFSGIHMENESYTDRAWAAREIAESAVAYFATKDWADLENRRILFIGDSLLRQVFISMACLAWDLVEDYTIPWFHNRQVRTQQPNTIGKGPHSKFEEGRVLLRGNIELIYHHGIGGLLELGEEYQTHETETWIKACLLERPFTGLALNYIDWKTLDSTTRNNNDDPRDAINSDSVSRERLTFSSRDIVLINASVHGGRSFNIRNMIELFECKKHRSTNHHAQSKRLWPNFFYMVTGPSHFPTKTGAFDKRLLDAKDDFGCIRTSKYTDLQVEESTKLRTYLPFIGTDILPMQMESGHLHVGGKDCLHWMQPGIPDLLAADILRHITATLTY